MPQAGIQIIMMHALPSISENKGNQTMKFGQFIGYNMKNIFLETYTKCGAGDGLRTSKNQN